jgi:ACS family sodium-dependent inorganic phosphate cotransporter
MAFFGFCNVYALRVNMSVAIVAMTSNYSYIENGTEKFVSIQYCILISFYT